MALPVGDALELVETDAGLEVLGVLEDDRASARQMRLLAETPGVELGMSPFGWHQERHMLMPDSASVGRLLVRQK